MNYRDFVNDYYLPSLKDLRESTRVGYESSIRLYLLPVFGERELEDIRVWDIEQWLMSIPSAGASEKAYKCLRQIIRRAIDWDMYNSVDPTRKHIKLPKKKSYEPRVLSVQEVRTLLRGFYGHSLEAAILCAVCLGLRRGETCGLKWSDIDLRDGSVSINRSVQYVSGHVVIEEPKTTKSRRTCYLPSFAIQRLREIKGSGWVIGNLSPDAVARRYKATLKSRNLPYTSLTNLRHTWATIALESGVDIATVAMMMGHTQISTTYDHYLKPRKRIYKDAQKLVERKILDA